MNHKEGFSANLVAAFLVVGASRFSLRFQPRSFGISIMGGPWSAQGPAQNTVKTMLFAWLVTVPVRGCSPL
jgi:phosphate/sulfate permease